MHGILLYKRLIITRPEKFYKDLFHVILHLFNEGGSPGGGLLPYMGHIGMCRCEGYGFQAVYSSLGYVNQSVWV